MRFTTTTALAITKRHTMIVIVKKATAGVTLFDYDSDAGKSIVFLEVSGRARIGYGRI